MVLRDRGAYARALVPRCAGEILTNRDGYQLRQSVALMLAFGSLFLQPTVDAEAGSESAAVVSAAAVRVSKVFIGTISIG